MTTSRYRPPQRIACAAGGLIIVVVLAAGCHDLPTAPGDRRDTPIRLDIQSASLGTPASELSSSVVIAAIAEPATVPFVTEISYTGQPQQVAVLTTPDSGFPTAGSTYLVVSSGDGRDPRVDGAWNWHRDWRDSVFGCACYPGVGDSASARIAVSLPSNALSLELDYRFFTADNTALVHGPPWYEWSELYVYSATGTVVGGAHGSVMQLATCGSWDWPVRCPGDVFTWFPGGVKRLIVDARPLAGQAISVVAYAFDRGWSNQRQTGVAIDRLNVVVGNLPPTADVGGPYVVDEGSSVEISGAASSDPEGDALTYSWDLDGDGAYDDAATAVFTHSFPDNGSYVVALRVADPEGATATATGWVTVLNVAPAASVTGPGVVNPVLGHASASVDVAFSDPGADAHEATIDCDNGGPPVQLGSTTSPFTHQCLYTTSAFGPRTVRVTVTDDDGGSSVVTHAVSVLYAWTGFFPPVASAPAENRAKAGSAIPLKFGLGGDQGLDVLASGSPSSRAASCAGQAIGEPFGASTPGASQLTYDPASQQYHYVWKSDKSWADTCRQISVQLADGTVHAAIIRFK